MPSKQPAQIDHHGTRRIVCPHCGYEEIDSCELSAGREDFSAQCSSCDGEMRVSRRIVVTYSTKKETA